MKIIYKFSGIFIWMVGSCFFWRGMTASRWQGNDLFSITLFGVCVMGFMSIFSFLYGAQRGHVVRYAMLMIYMAMGVALDYNNSPVLIILVSVMIFISLKVRRDFLVQYNSQGIVDYFKRYFN